MISKSPGCLVNGYSFLIMVWFGSRLLFFDTVWWLALVNTAALFLFVPLPILLGTAAFSTNRKQWSILVIPTAVFLLLYGRLLLPQFSSPAANPTTLRVMTFNLLYENKEVETIAQVILASQVDIVGVQETTQFHAHQLGELLTTQFPYQSVRPGNRYGDVGLFSRYPIEISEDLLLPPRHLAMQAIVQMNNQTLQLFVVHLMPNQLGNVPLSQLPERAKERYATRLQEIMLLNQVVAAATEPVILLCDCNFTETSQAYAQLDSFLQDSFGETGWGLGLTATDARYLPTQRIDYVWHSAELTAVSAQVGEFAFSDHLPVVVELAIK